MADIKLFIATSLDGFIARENGSLDWLPGSDPNAEVKPTPEDTPPNDGGYGDFIATIDVVVMGRSTYEEILGFGVDWPYGDCSCFVVTTNNDYKTKTENTTVLNSINPLNIEKVKNASNKNVWIVGGGQIITEFLNHNAIDKMTLSVFSIILGKGIPLFPNIPLEQKFNLQTTEVFDGFVNLVYNKA